MENLAYESFYGDLGFKQGLPWLYYDKSRPNSQIIGEGEYDIRVKFRASFGYENEEIGIFRKMKFKLAKYDIEGNFHGFEDLTNQLVICEKSREEISRIYEIGTSVNIPCTYDLSNLISTNKYDRPRLENFFFELYMVDWDESLIDIPVLIGSVKNQNGITNT